MSENLTFKVDPEQQQDFQFNLKFDWDGVPAVLLDLAPPLGGRPVPTRSESSLALSVTA